jgi:hypothetical protein
MIKPHIAYNFYYYTSEGEFRINVKSMLMYASVISALLIVTSVDYQIQHQMYFEFAISTGLFLFFIIVIRRLNRD